MAHRVRVTARRARFAVRPRPPCDRGFLPLARRRRTSSAETDNLRPSPSFPAAAPHSRAVVDITRERTGVGRFLAFHVAVDHGYI